MIKAVTNLIEIKMLKTALALTGGRFFNLAVSISLLLIQARFIGPEIAGVCQAYAIPLGYLWILTLGIPSALARELPYYLATGEREKALQLARTAQSFSVVTGGVCSSAFALLSLRAFMHGDYLSAAGWAFQIVNGFYAIYSSYIRTLFRSTDEFIKIAKSNTISAIANLVTFPLIFWNPYLGIWTKNMSGTLASNIYLYFKRPFKLGFALELQHLTSLIKFGLPLIAIGYIEVSLWSSTQLSLVYKMGGAPHLGLFVFINNILLALLIIPDSVAEILRPRFAAVYGESNGNIIQTLKIAFKPLIAALLVSMLAIILAWFFIDDIIINLLPKYVEAIPAIEIALLLIPVMTVHCVKYIFVVCKNMLYNLCSTLPGYITGIALLYIFLSKGFAFKYIFLPYIVGQLVNLMITIILIIKASKQKGLQI